jgi:hypothetical protein
VYGCADVSIPFFVCDFDDYVERGLMMGYSMIHAAVSSEGVRDWVRVRKEKRDDHYEEIA